MGLAAGALAYPQKASADKFTGDVFLTWSQSGQDTYIGTSVTMAAMIVGRTNAERGACIDNWYASSETVTAARNTEIRDTIGRNSEYHPSAVILLVLEGACGAFVSN